MRGRPPLPERYEVGERLGEGATGDVWAARDRLSGRAVAVKVAYPHLSRHPRFRARFAREVALAASVVHPRIVPVHDFGLVEGVRPYVVLARADRGSLAELLARRPQPLDAIRIVDQVLDALGALHARGIVHQDLKPENVLLHEGEGGRADAWVADFGIAGALGELALDGRRRRGTPEWMAPEQVEGRVQELGPWTDLYAVGLLLHALLGGERDERGGPVRPVRLADAVPAGLVDVVRTLLEPDPRQRYDRAADARRALQGAVSGLTPAVLAGEPAELPTVTTTFSPTLLPDAREALVGRPDAPSPAPTRVPRWNRVPPGPMARRVPPEDGRGGAPPADPRVFALREPPLVVRDEVRQELWRHARAVVRFGEPRVVLVVGRAGSGKSRVVGSVARALDHGGFMEALTLRYHSPAGVDDGYRGAVRELLVPWNDTRFEAERRLARWLARDRQLPPEAVAHEAAVLARWCGYVPAGEPPVNAGVGLVFLYRHLDARAWRGGACLVLEDVHDAQAEGDGLDICEALLERAVGERPVLVLATLSSDALERDRDLAGRVRALERIGAIVLRVPRFSDAEMHRFLEEAFCAAPELAEQVAPLCDGSPTFATMLMRDLAARGQLEAGPGGRFRLAPGAELPAEGTDFEALCARRMEGALGASADPERAERALAAVALAGSDAPVPVVRAVDDQGLDALLATGLVRQVSFRLFFEHDGIARAARRVALTRPDAADLHRALADAWEQLGRTTGIDVDLPHGQHRLHAGEPGRAVVPLLRVGRSALAEGRPGLALDAARLAELAAERAGVPMARVEARQRQIEALLDLGRVDTAARVLRDSRNLPHVDRLSRAQFRALAARAALERGRPDAARRFQVQAAATFEATRDRAGMIAVAQCEAELHRRAGDPARAAGRYERMLRLNRGEDRRVEVAALVGLAETWTEAGRLARARGPVDRLRRLARESGDTRDIARAVAAEGFLRRRAGDREGAVRCLATGRALAATLGDDRLRVRCELALGALAMGRGEVDEAERLFESAVRHAAGRGWSAEEAEARLRLSLIAIRRWAARVARRELDRADALLQHHPRHPGWLYVGLLRALWAAEEGDERGCAAWWAVANERGLADSTAPDLWLPLERLSTAAARHGWREIARRAAMLAGRVAGVGRADEAWIEE